MTFLFLSFFSCIDRGGPFDTQYLPDGVKKSDYQHFKPILQNIDQAKIHPPHWWLGMANDTIQLLVYDTNIKEGNVRIENSALNILSIDTVASQNYLFINLSMSPEARSGKYDIIVDLEGRSRTYPFELKDRNTQSSYIDPIDYSDRIYLIFPDRFANGDYENDSFNDLRQQGVNRSKMYFRHGGDLDGITQHIDYIVDLGFTAIWLNPVTTSDQAYSSYHGYASTDHYSIDPRFGGNGAYKKLSEACRKKGLKLIKDVVPNHVGDQHWFIRDIPSEDWIHQFGAYQASNHKHESTFDSLASPEERAAFLQGWFDYSMPDLNQRNPLLSKYLIQNSIWWIEEMGIDGYRVDTYGYSYPEFMAQWAQAIKNEYPNFYIFGEVWANDVRHQSLYLKAHPATMELDPKLDGITDFQLNYAIISALNEEKNDSTGIANIYNIINQDSLYTSPFDNVTCLDNHDMDRFYSVINEDIDLFKSGLTLLFGLRGIPCIYYGTEILHKNLKNPDGLVRADFNGGWKEDKQNKFTEKGRNKGEKETHAHIKKLNQIRSRFPEINQRQGVQKIIEEGTYSISYEVEKGYVELLFNQNSRAQSIQFYQLGKDDNNLSAQDLINEKELGNPIKLKAKEAKLIYWRNQN